MHIDCISNFSCAIAAKRKVFEQKRKFHYNEFQAVKLARQLLEKDDDEELEDDEAAASSRKASKAKKKDKAAKKELAMALSNDVNNQQHHGLLSQDHAK